MHENQFGNSHHQYEKHPEDKHGYGHQSKNRKSFLSEIFDF